MYHSVPLGTFSICSFPAVLLVFMFIRNLLIAYVRFMVVAVFYCRKYWARIGASFPLFLAVEYLMAATRQHHRLSG
jgi:hypothetical protein